MLRQQWSGAITGEEIQVLDVLSNRASAVVEWRYRGTLKQEIAGLSATGKTYDVPIVTVMETIDGKVAEARLYLNWALLA